MGDIFSTKTNPERKKPFDIRAVMRAVADQDHRPLERWAAMAGAESAVVFDAHLGGYPVTLLGIESRPLRRSGFLPADGPTIKAIGTIDPVPKGTKTTSPQPIKFTAAGKAELVNIMSAFKTPFNVLVGSTIVVKSGQPVPTGKLDAVVHIRGHAGL